MEREGAFAADDTLAFLAVFKVQPCPHPTTDHLRAACPFWHDAQDRRMLHRTPTNNVELMYHPAMFRTRVCGLGSACPYPEHVCPWAHGARRLRPPTTFHTVSNWLARRVPTPTKVPQDSRTVLQAGDEGLPEAACEALWCAQRTSSDTLRLLSNHVCAVVRPEEWRVLCPAAGSPAQTYAFDVVCGLLHAWADAAHVSLDRPKCMSCGKIPTPEDRDLFASCTRRLHYCCAKCIGVASSKGFDPVVRPIRCMGCDVPDCTMELSPRMCAKVFLFVAGEALAFVKMDSCFHCHWNAGADPGANMLLCEACDHYTCKQCGRVFERTGDWAAIGSHLALCEPDSYERRLCQVLELSPTPHARQQLVYALTVPPCKYASTGLLPKELWPVLVRKGFHVGCPP